MRARITTICLRRVGLVLLLSYAGVTNVAAQPAKAPAPKPATVAKADIGPSVQKLKSGEEGQVRAALDELRIAGPGAASAAPAVAEALARGLNEPLTRQAIDTLADLESEGGSAILAQYATHRTVAIRRSAVLALTRTKGPAAVPALRRALGDADAQVRGRPLPVSARSRRRTPSPTCSSRSITRSTKRRPRSGSSATPSNATSSRASSGSFRSMSSRAASIRCSSVRRRTSPTTRGSRC